MILLRGASVVLADRVLGPATVAIDGDEIVEVAPGTRRAANASVADLHGHFIVPGFIDVHVHGVEGHDVQDPAAPIGAVARRLPKFGVTAFCPTTVACGPADLAQILRAIRQARDHGVEEAARVLPAHLESNFINPDYRGAQPIACLRLPPTLPGSAPGVSPSATGRERSDFGGEDILATIAGWGSEVGIVTLAPELEGALPFIRHLVERGHRVSLGHSGASFEAGLAGIDAGARQATHLFNRMPPLHHRDPGLVGAILAREETAAEIVCDGHHVHPAVLQAAVSVKGPARTMAITDGTAVSGLPVGSTASLGGRRITARETAAFLDDGTLAGSVLTMDRAFRFLVRTLERTLVDAAVMCSTTPATELGLQRLGRLAAGMIADLVVLDGELRVAQTWVGGRKVFEKLYED